MNTVFQNAMLSFLNCGKNLGSYNPISMLKERKAPVPQKNECFRDNFFWQADSNKVTMNKSLDAPIDVDLNVVSFQNMTELGRNDICHCGSGDRYKNHHGQLM